jgi:hypothetical protein
MKKLLFITVLLLIYSSRAMENPVTPFPEEGFVDPDDAVWVPGKPIWNFYDGCRIKHMLNPNLNKLITKYLEMIIAKKCGSQALSLFQNKPDDVRSQIMSRYGKAVCWQIQKYHYDTDEIAPEVIEKAERQVPFTLNELIFIEQNIKCYGNQYDEPNIKLALKDLDGQPRSAQRAYLNNLLNVVKTSTKDN